MKLFGIKPTENLDIICMPNNFIRPRALNKSCIRLILLLSIYGCAPSSQAEPRRPSPIGGIGSHVNTHNLAVAVPSSSGGEEYFHKTVNAFIGGHIYSTDSLAL